MFQCKGICKKFGENVSFRTEKQNRMFRSKNKGSFLVGVKGQSKCMVRAIVYVVPNSKQTVICEREYVT